MSLVEILGIFVGFGADFGVLGLISALLAEFWAERGAGRAAAGAWCAGRCCFWAIFGVLTPFRPRFDQFDRGFAWDIFRGYFGDLNNCLALPR